MALWVPINTIDQKDAAVFVTCIRILAAELFIIILYKRGQKSSAFNFLMKTQ